MRLVDPDNGVSVTLTTVRVSVDRRVGRDRTKRLGLEGVKKIEGPIQPTNPMPSASKKWKTNGPYGGRTRDLGVISTTL